MIPYKDWPAEKSYYKTYDKMQIYKDYENWGRTSNKKMNEWFISDALYVLNETGRLNY